MTLLAPCGDSAALLLLAAACGTVSAGTGAAVASVFVGLLDNDVFLLTSAFAVGSGCFGPSSAGLCSL